MYNFYHLGSLTAMISATPSTVISPEPAGPETDDDGFMNIPDEIDDELPFS